MPAFDPEEALAALLANDSKAFVVIGLVWMYFRTRPAAAVELPIFTT